MAELLLELFSEEIPARMQARAAKDLHDDLLALAHQAGFTKEVDEPDVKTFVTHRRLVGLIRKLPARQPDQTMEKKGPRINAPEKAIQGFLKSNGLKSINQAEIRELDKGSFYFTVKSVKGRPTAEILAELIPDLVYGFSWPKSMRWANTVVRWVRPIHNVLCIFNGKVVKGAIGLASTNDDPEIRLRFTNVTFGHRFLAPKKIAVKGFADYKKKLKTAKVMLDQGARRAEIVKQAKRLAARAKLKLKDDPELLDEVTGLVEWPVVLIGRIDDQFMDLPPEVLTTAMRAHQKYLALHDKKDIPANRFLVVANMTATDKGKAIVAGNERVLRARLGDARFFWDQDRKHRLESRVAELDGVVFHAKLGSLREKVERVARAAGRLAEHIPGADPDHCQRAGYLAKADLVTGMVGEFPELQGVMGRYYARHDGEPAEVAHAIAEHYAPAGPDERCPSAPVSVAVALADKIDTLAGFFAIDEKPTGSKDPYALRRAALGVIRLIVENKLRLPLNNVFHEALETYRKKLPVPEKNIEEYTTINDREGQLPGEVFSPHLDTTIVRQSLLDFFADRLKVVLRDQGLRHDLIAAVFALGGEDDLVRLLARVAALEKFLASEDGAHLLVAYRRAANIVRIEQKRDNTRYNQPPDARYFEQEEETALYHSLSASMIASSVFLEKEDFTGALAESARLRRPVDQFFDEVTVNCDDARLRVNRLRLLSELGATLGSVADFSKIEG